MPGQRLNLDNRRTFLHLREIVFRVLKLPGGVTAKYTVGKIPHSLSVLAPWIRRESAIAHDFRRHALIGFLDPVFEHLQIGVAVKINESGRNYATRAVDSRAFRRRFKRTYSGDTSIFDQNVAGYNRRRQNRL